MVKQIGHFIFDFLRVRIFGRNHKLGSLFSHLLQDFVDALFKQVIRIGPFLRMCLPVRNDLIDIFKDLQRIRILVFRLRNLMEEAGPTSGVAGRACLGHLCQNRVQITVHNQLLHILEMAAGEAFDPELLTAPAEIRHLSCLNGPVEGFLIHVGYHQNLVRPVVLNHHRNQAIRAQLELRPFHIAVQRI